jgi:hypothetical protein
VADAAGHQGTRGRVGRLKPDRVDHFKLSTDPLFIDKLTTWSGCT